jgi:hypothetical protein
MLIHTDKEGKAAIENLLIVAIQAAGFDNALDTVVKIQKAIQLVEEPKKPVDLSNMAGGTKAN